MSRFKYFFYSLLAALLVIMLQADVIQPSNFRGKTASKSVPADSGITNFSTVKVADVVPVGTQATYYISPQGDDNNPGTVSQPFRTIAKARDTIRPLASNMSGNILVYVRGGEYVLTNPLNFGVGDSGTNGFSVTYQAYPHEKPVISGGYTITGWTAFKNGIYQTNVGTLRFRQLYVNGKKGVRARTSNDGSFYRMKSWDKANQQLVLNASEIKSWQNLNNVEMVVLRGSNQNRLRISSYTTLGTDVSVVPMDPERARAFGYNDRTLFDHQPYYFENALEFLDAPGEWYLNSASGDLFYLPQAGEDISSSTVVAPALASLVQINGTTDKTVHNIKFQGLAFQYATWMTPSNEGYAETQAGEYVDNNGSGRPKMPAAVTVSLAEQLTFERNIFKNMGAGAINFDHSTRNNSIIGNVFTEISGNAISIDRRSWYPQPYNEFVTSGDVIKNNYIYRVAQDFFACVGIFVGFTDSMVIQHNELAQLPYTGISLGWGWTNNDTSLKNNVAQYNDVHNFMTLNNDGGGIYTLSKQPGTQIVENYIHGAVRSQWAHVWPIAGVYLDNGSGSIKVESNVIQDTPEAVFNQVENLQTNIIKTTVSNSQSVIGNSGIESAYSDIKNYL